jgi:hypothetical protein
MEAKHLASIVHTMPFFGIIEVHMQDGTITEGVIRGNNIGNNFTGGMVAPTAYKADVTIQTLQGDLRIIDVLDIKEVRDVWAARSGAYEQAGLIKIVDFPK